MLEYSCGTWLTGLGLQQAEPSAGGVSLWVTLLAQVLTLSFILETLTCVMTAPLTRTWSERCLLALPSAAVCPPKSS